MFKETGANPVRARRRNMCNVINYQYRNWDKSLKQFEKTFIIHRVGIFEPIIRKQTTSASFTCKKSFLGGELIMNFLSKFMKSILCAVLVAVMALTVSGCGEQTPITDNQQTTDRIIKGEGETIFNFDVTDLEGSTTSFEIHTDKTIVGEALLELGLIEGEPSEYGLYVKKVNGIEADFDKDQTYWAFYINGEYAMSGVDTTEIEADTSYAFKIEK